MTSAIQPTRPRFSVLDRSRTRQGRQPAQALRDTVRFARQIEELGYHRFWVSEHHSVPGVAGSAPTVLAAAVAAATSRIRVGTGGVMLPNHQPLVVAEQFGVLESLFPGRIDMGLGRCVGFTDGIRRALGRGKDDAEDFAGQLAELLGYFSGEHPVHPEVHAQPAEGLRVAAFVLATGAGAAHAAALGLPLVIAAVRGEEAMLRAIDRYRADFRPSLWSPAQRPYVVVSGTVAVGRTAEEARQLLLPEAWSSAYSRTHGVFPPLLPVREISSLSMTAKERALFEEAQNGHIHGTEDEVGAALDALIERSAADEVLVTTSTYDRALLLDSYRRLARLLPRDTPSEDLGPRLDHAAHGA
ncbi:MsnO8 family LLM class oxidoreductase [Streptomyces sp. H27-D2]|uniref:MsnO8 family LLM class oxidoreductase n=1 Tax=Streptomyces sp. H27-D2 TaxID=3046304 RepID=UPI002DBA575D|nr:MsnO8 family LLM class oxidoreductase [Streptomyces sp. H27-D2]MEC4020073.1 MsnO8 family LLM class oxidoreductase [Streptomyces sp. H27-D2]